MADEGEKSDEVSKPAGPVVEMVPEGDNRPRMVCTDCGFVHYRNPLVVVGTVCAWEGRILLCRRAIDPRRGYWTIPAGYLELRETAHHGAAREAWEEAGVRIEPEAVLAVYSIPRLSQVQVIYRAVLPSSAVEAGPESLEVGLFDWSEIPWNDLAFPSVRWALDHYRAYLESGDPTPQGNPPGETGRY